MTALKGINLGGWLVAERWMTPELFAGVADKGERAIGRELGIEAAARRLTHHRETFITEADFEWLAEKGFEVVRLPVGYWLFMDDTDYVSGLETLDRAFEWAQKHGLKVILDLHALPGSQNGNDHSGEEGNIRFYRYWNRRKALRVLAIMADNYGYHPALLGLQIINEPQLRHGYDRRRLLRYYRQALRLLDDMLPARVKVVVGDGWQPRVIARRLAAMPARQRIILDVHLYQAFAPADKMLGMRRHIAKVNGEWRELLTDVAHYVPPMVGEWSGALDPSTYDGMQDAEHMAATRRYVQAQCDMYRRVAWCEAYWSYYVPDGGDWSYRQVRK